MAEIQLQVFYRPHSTIQRHTLHLKSTVFNSHILMLRCLRWRVGEGERGGEEECGDVHCYYGQLIGVGYVEWTVGKCSSVGER